MGGPTMASGRVRLAACGLALGAAACAIAAPLLAQSAPLPGVTAAPTFRSGASPAPQIPETVTGSWQVVLDGPTHKLRTNYNVEVKIGGFRPGMPEAVVSYFAGNAQRPSTICRSQLTLIGVEGTDYVFAESLNHRGGKDPCPIRQQIVITPGPGMLVVRWRDGGRKPKVRIEATAYRASGGMECRLVSGDGSGSGQEWCRDAEGNWAPRRSA